MSQERRRPTRKQWPGIKARSATTPVKATPSPRLTASRPAPDRLAAARAEYIRARQLDYFDSVLNRKGPDLALDEAIECLRGTVEWMASIAGPRLTYDAVQHVADVLASQQIAE